ncbi:WcaG Nucleoside-diphosphate-sugar epimerases [Candidatus Nanopelagicaceae bacterium]
MTRTLITGGTGFIGRSIVQHCLKLGDEIRVLDNNSRGSIEKLSIFKNDFEFIMGDIRDPKVVNRSLKKIDRVIHLAYINGTEHFYSKPFEILDVGIRGTLNLLLAHNKFQFSELVMASTSETYQNADRIPTPEKVELVIPDVLNPRYSYGGGKIAMELLALNYARQSNLQVKIFRPHNIYGPDMGNEHVIPQLISKIKDRLKLEPLKREIQIEIQGTGNETRSFCYIDDFITQIDLILEDKEPTGIYHVGVSDEISIHDLIKTLGTVLGKRLEVVETDIAPGSPVRRCPDVTKMASLGFSQQWTLERGLIPTTKWYLAN